jgi:hypothetical protein
MKPRGRSLAFLGLAAALSAPTALHAQREPGLDLSEPIIYYIDEGSDGSGFREGDRTLAAWALEAWGRQAEPALKMKAGSEESASIRIYWVPADGGRYGEMQARIVDGRFVADVFVHADPDGLGRDIARHARLDSLFRDTIVYLTCVHELGHAFGLPHTRAFADIMYSFQYGGDFVDYFMRFRKKLKSRDDIQKASPFSAGDVGAFKELAEGGAGL